MFCISGKEMGAPTGNWLYDSARELTEMASMQFAVYGLMNPYTYQRPKITPLPNETGLTVPGGTGVAVVPNGTAPALNPPYLPGQYTEYPAAVQGWAQQALPGGGSSIEGGSKTYKNSSDITKDIRQNKPLNSPAIDAWYGKNGTISIDENGVWTYHDWEGNSVSYPNGYPDFKSADMVRQEAPIGPFVERNKDFAKAREMGYIKSADGTWHHHEDGVTLQEVETILHDRFRHRGGISNLKKK